MVVLWTATSLIKSPAKIPVAMDRLVQIVAGLVSGAIGGLTAIWSPPMVMYLLARRHVGEHDTEHATEHSEKEDFVRFTGFLILCGSVPLFAGYVSNGLLTTPLALLSAAMIVPTLIGFSIGERLRKRLDSGQFRTVVLCLFCLMGLNLIRRAYFL